MADSRNSWFADQLYRLSVVVLLTRIAGGETTLRSGNVVLLGLLLGSLSIAVAVVHRAAA
ncbi:hypothetical protein BRD03_04045 [Halobacteriales archaeon QS_9_68_17]|nr:MAG: hypothetical protein BRD03_04045 [Halobacteriales archaeon QS_9_68_17]